MENTRKFRFGRFEADVETGELRKDGRKVRLQEKSFQVLLALLEQCGQLVTREELRRRLWAENTFVDVENGLNTALSKLREALGGSACCIETLARRGYRFRGIVEQIGAPAARQQRTLALQLKHIEPGIVVVEAAGRIVLGPECTQIEWLISDLLAKDEKRIILDLAGVSHIDSTGVGIMVVCSAKAQAAGGELRIAGAQGLVDHILRLTKIDSIIALHASTAAAMEGFARLAERGQ